MKPNQIVEILKINRISIQKNVAYAEDEFRGLQEQFKNDESEEVQLNLELNKCMVEYCIHSNHPRVIETALPALAKYGSTPYYDALSLLHIVTGRSYAFLSVYDKAAHHLSSAVSIIDTHLPHLIFLKADTLNSLAMNLHFSQPGSPLILQYLQQAIDLVGDKGTQLSKANSLNTIGNIYMDEAKPAEALEKYKEALIIYENQFDIQNTAVACSNIGNSYMLLGDYLNAEVFLKKALMLRIKAAPPMELGISFNNLAVLYQNKKEYKTAIEYLDKAKHIHERSGNAIELKHAEDKLKEVEALLKEGA